MINLSHIVITNVPPLRYHYYHHVIILTCCLTVLGGSQLPHLPHRDAFQQLERRAALQSQNHSASSPCGL